MHYSLRSLLLTTALVGPALPMAFGVRADAACAPLVFSGAAQNVVCSPGAGESFNTLGGADTLTVTGGTVGAVQMDTGNDTATITGGTVGALNQGAGTDKFVMTGGTVASLDQAGDTDTAYINGGTITGSFDDGDYVEFAAGTIGDVNLNTGNNTFYMWGTARISGNLNSESGLDEYFLYGGTIGGTISTGSARDIITIGGTQSVFNGAAIPPSTGATAITGDIMMEGGNDTLIQNGGSINGSVYLDGGPGHTNALGTDTFDDTAVFAGGTLAGSVFADFTGQVGADHVTVSGTAIGGSVALGDGNNIYDMTGGSVGGSVTAGTGTDTVNMAGGAVTGQINTGAGADTLHLDGGTVGGGVDTGAGADDVSIAGTAITGNVDTGTENDTITMTGGSVTGSVLAGAGDDTLKLNGGTVGGDVATGAGADDVSIAGTAITGNVDTGTENDTVTMTGGSVTGSVLAGAGDDTLKLNGGTVGGDVATGAGADDVSIAGAAITGNVDTGTENDTITLAAGQVTGTVLAGAGDDTFDWTGGTLGGGFAGGDGSDTATVTASTYDGSQTLDGGDDAAAGDGFIDVLTLNGLTIATNGASLLNWETITLDATTLTVADGALTAGEVRVGGGSVLTSPGALTVTGDVAVDAGGTWLVPDAGAVTGDLANTGTVDMQDGATGDTVTVGGDYVGGGVLALDVDTGAGTADTLEIAGDVTGPTTQIALDNLSVDGSYTGTGPGAGIALVTVGGARAEDDFALQAGPIVAGGFLYDLNLETDGTFYLQSALRNDAVAGAALGLVVADVEQSFIGTRHERVGEQEKDRRSNLWGRAVGAFSNEDVKASGIGTLALDSNLTGLQAGLDLVAVQSASGSRTRLGVYGGLSWLSGTSSTTGAGGARAGLQGDGHVAALYASHDSADGWYADAVLQGTWMDISAPGSSLSTHATGWLASLEAGKAIALTATASFEPQVQVIYGHNSTRAAVDSDGALNQFSKDETLLGRVGARLKSTQELGSGSGTFVTGWLKADVWVDGMANDQSASISTAAATTFVALERKTAWADLGIGFDVQATSGLTLFADGDMSFGLDGRYDSFGGKAGLRLSF